MNHIITAKFIDPFLQLAIFPGNSIKISKNLPFNGDTFATN